MTFNLIGLALLAVFFMGCASSPKATETNRYPATSIRHANFLGNAVVTGNLKL